MSHLGASIGLDQMANKLLSFVVGFVAVAGYPAEAVLKVYDRVDQTADTSVASGSLNVLLIGNDYKQQFPLIGYGGIESHVESVAYGLFEANVSFRVIAPRVTSNPRGTSYPFEIIVSHEDSGGARNLKSYTNVLHRFISHNQRTRWIVQNYPWLESESFALWSSIPETEFRLETKKDPKTLLFVGSLSDSKGLTEFQQLAEWNPDWQFVMYGPGHFTSKHANVEFKGELKRG